MNALSTKFRASLFATLLAILPWSPASHAQTSPRPGWFSVPFGFQCGSQYYEPGDYTITEQSRTGYVFMIEGLSRSWFTVMRPSDVSQPATTSRFVFLRYGDRYFLKEIWIAGDSTHFRCTTSKTERELQRAQKAISPDGGEVSVAETQR